MKKLQKAQLIIFNSQKLKVIILTIAFCLLPIASINAQQIAILKYNGSGDWYANPTALPNLIEFCNNAINTTIKTNLETVEANSIDVFNYPILFMTGHGNVIFSKDAITNLKTYLISGGFLHISDNYGLDKFIRREFKRIFPTLDFQEIPFNHPIYHQTFDFEEGVPKIHEHDNKPPQGFGLFYEGRLICFYDYEADLSDGWEDEEMHNDPLEIREKALQMGSNIIEYAFKN
ncbi:MULTISPECIES: DUF4159 domain-containing protein [Flavobacteriaceae]|uniref:DUF4159 domain-containing protein n=2 Tax=Flavobacteriaceae TaxID=49546 RepID=A0A4Y8AX55_9FLAO|nr:MULTISPECIES: DUF4159 domain-containing protein [Flavobacteriaceae]TEW77110.1 DUF4159 domain-containing protein [Gramella jeungdoensis]GGK57788.1 hypothetical protein GCM10007963_27480 [Lutibacter litoralis]